MASLGDKYSYSMVFVTFMYHCNSYTYMTNSWQSVLHKESKCVHGFQLNDNIYNQLASFVGAQIHIYMVCVCTVFGHCWGC